MPSTIISKHVALHPHPVTGITAASLLFCDNYNQCHGQKLQQQKIHPYFGPEPFKVISEEGPMVSCWNVHQIHIVHNQANLLQKILVSNFQKQIIKPPLF